MLNKKRKVNEEEKEEKEKEKEEKKYIINCRGVLKIELTINMVDKIPLLKEMWEENSGEILVDFDGCDIHKMLDFLIGDNEFEIILTNRLRAVLSYFLIDFSHHEPKEEKEVKQPKVNITNTENCIRYYELLEIINEFLIAKNQNQLRQYLATMHQSINSEQERVLFKSLKELCEKNSYLSEGQHYYELSNIVYNDSFSIEVYDFIINTFKKLTKNKKVIK